MAEQQDIRWKQRFDNYSKAFKRLKEAVNLLKEENDNDEKIIELLEEGLVQRYEYTLELAWNVMKDYEEYQGYKDIQGPKDAVRKALNIGLIDNKEWIEALTDRNLTSHTYDQSTAEIIINKILYNYFPMFESFTEKMNNIFNKEFQLI